MDTNYDIIVIGSGICGSLLAFKLSKAGKKVLILEAGPDKMANRIEMAGNFTDTIDKNPSSPYRNVTDGYILGPDKDKSYYQQDSTSAKFKSTFLRLAGGSTWHFLGNMPRFVPSDFKIHSLYQQGEKALDWPISYDDLEKFYCEAEKELGVSGDHEQWNGYLQANRSKSYPMNKIWQSYGDHFFIDKIHGKEIEGYKIEVMSTPQARNSTIYDGRPACAGNSSCVPICPIQAKYDATVHLKKATDLGAILQTNSIVTKLKIDPEGAVTSLTYLQPDRTSNEIIIGKSTTVVIAAHAIETPRLLLNSGIANSSGQVGKNLMDHLQGYGLAISSEPIFPFRGPPTTSGIDVFRDGMHRKNMAAFRMSIGNDGWGRAESPTNLIWNKLSSGTYGKDLKEGLNHQITRMARISFSTEMLPQHYNKVTLSSNCDPLGIPKPKIDFKLDQYNIDAFHYAYKVCGQIFNLLGWEFQEKKGGELEKYLQNYSGAGHIIGTTRMGNDPKTSVTDSYGKAHDHKNLYIAGPSLFPTSGTANPTLTAAALTLRTSDYLISLYR